MDRGVCSIHAREGAARVYRRLSSGRARMKQIKRGRAVVRLDTDFAKVIKRGDYRVFLSPEVDCRGLYVRKSAASKRASSVAENRTSPSPIASWGGAETSRAIGASPRSIRAWL